MTPRQIRAQRLALKVAPRFWDFAYPSYGRGWAPLRLLALRLWILAFRFAWSKADR